MPKNIAMVKATNVVVLMVIYNDINFHRVLCGAAIKYVTYFFAQIDDTDFELGDECVHSA